MVYSKDLTEAEKWMIGAYVTALFLLISSPFMYKITGKLTDLIGFTTSTNGCPNPAGLLLHTIVFFLLLRGVMEIPKPEV